MIFFMKQYWLLKYGTKNQEFSNQPPMTAQPVQRSLLISQLICQKSPDFSTAAHNMVNFISLQCLRLIATVETKGSKKLKGSEYSKG